MVASIQVELRSYRCTCQQRGTVFGAFAQVIGRTSIPFLRNYVLPAAKRVVADLFKISGPEIAQVVVFTEQLKAVAKSVGKQTLRKLIAISSRKWKGASGGREFPHRKQANTVISVGAAKQTSRSWRDFSSLITSSTYQPYVQFLGNSEEKIPITDYVFSFDEQKVNPATSMDENKIEFEIKTLRYYYVDLRQTFSA